MQVAHRSVYYFNRTVFSFFCIGLSAILFSIGGNAAGLEKVNYTIDYYPALAWHLQKTGDINPEEDNFHLRFRSALTCWFTFQCPTGCQCRLAATSITITCPDGLSSLEVEYPSGNNWSLLLDDPSSALYWLQAYDWAYFGTYTSDWTSKDDKNETSNATSQYESYESNSGNVSTAVSLDSYGGSPKSNTPITIYVWYNTGLNSITLSAFKHIENISECFLILSLNNIENIQARQFEKLSKLHGLYLDNNKITSLHQSAFIGLGSLVYLYLYHNKIANILPGQFQELSNLNNLYVYHNDIGAIGQQDFQGLDNLQILNIAHNNIVQIHSHGFQNLINLLQLHLDHNRISEIPSDLFLKQVMLDKLYLDFNMITDLHPLQFQSLANLWLLHLGYNNISTIHSYLFQNLTSLVYLYLDHNMISEIHPLQFQNHSSLWYLNLGHNMFSEIPLLQLQSLEELHLTRNTISEIHPLHFENLSSLQVLDLEHNTISQIHPLSFQNLTKLISLDLAHNMISKIHPLQFENLTALSSLKLSYNSIAKIHSYQFQSLNRLFVLRLAYNNISKIPSHLVRNHSDLAWLDLTHNRISAIPPELLQNFSQLVELHLEYNMISEIHPLLFQNVSTLEWLHLDYNDIIEIHPNQFQSLHDLKFLGLSHNSLVKFTLASTIELRKLEYLSLSNNKLRVLSHAIFKHTIMPSLKALYVSSNHIIMINTTILVNNTPAPIELIDLRQNKLYFLNSEVFKGFRNSTAVLVDNEATCCFITTVNCSATIPKSQFLTCGRLLPNLIQRIAMWILGLFAVLSNLGVLFYRYRNKEKENKVQLLLISNLSLSDMIMGIYMIMISSADLYYKKMFPSEFWRVSFACKFAGTLSVLSSEASVFFVTLISVDRLIGIRYPFSTYRFGTKTSRILSLGLWLMAILISIISTILSSVNPDWYDVSEVCTGLPLSRRNVYENRFYEYNAGKTSISWVSHFINSTNEVITSHQPGMYFGIAIFSVLNFILIIVICFCYVVIFVTSIKTATKAGRARDLNQERKMATKMGAIVITDIACWAPIIILSILVQSGRHVVTPRVYTWIVTFVLPINSAINPFLYTLANVIIDFMNKKSKVLTQEA